MAVQYLHFLFHIQGSILPRLATATDTSLPFQESSSNNKNKTFHLFSYYMRIVRLPFWALWRMRLLKTCRTIAIRHRCWHIHCRMCHSSFENLLHQLLQNPAILQLNGLIWCNNLHFIVFYFFFSSCPTGDPTINRCGTFGVEGAADSCGWLLLLS